MTPREAFWALTAFFAALVALAFGMGCYMLIAAGVPPTVLALAWAALFAVGMRYGGRRGWC